MKISSLIYEKLLESPLVPPEIGGIIGGRAFVIDNAVYDNSNLNSNKYVPNVPFINRVISDWHNSGIEFYGIFHSHAPQWNTLSNVDVIYINKIMKSMPELIKSLLFPLIFPRDKIKWYKAEIVSENVCITEINVEVI